MDWMPGADCVLDDDRSPRRVQRDLPSTRRQIANLEFSGFARPQAQGQSLLVVERRDGLITAGEEVSGDVQGPGRGVRPHAHFRRPHPDPNPRSSGVGIGRFESHELVQILEARVADHLPTTEKHGFHASKRVAKDDEVGLSLECVPAITKFVPDSALTEARRRMGCDVAVIEAEQVERWELRHERHAAGGVDGQERIRIGERHAQEITDRRPVPLETFPAGALVGRQPTLHKPMARETCGENYKKDRREPRKRSRAVDACPNNPPELRWKRTRRGLG